MQPLIYKHTAGWRSLMVYVVYQALIDLTSVNLKVRKDAKEFLLSEYGEWFCEVLGLNHNLVKDIDFDNPLNSLKLLNI